MNQHVSFDIDTFRSELDNILSWWADNIIVEGKFIGRIDGRERKWPEASLGVVFMTRILWSFSAAARMGFNTHFNVAEKAFHFLERYFIDRDHGGLYWLVSKEGEVLNDKKQIYAQAFGIYAYSEYYKVTGYQEALFRAQQLYYYIQQNGRDKVNNGYWEALTRQWQLMAEVRLSEKEGNDKKTMNTHLHIVEAFTNLYRCGRGIHVGNSLKELVTLYLDKFVDVKTGRLKLFFDEMWNENFTHHSYGHEIESAWLLREAALELADSHLIEMTGKISTVMAQRVMEEGIDGKGAVYNEKNLKGVFDKYRDWWPQAEGVIGFYDAYQHTQNKVFYNMSFNCWKYIKQYMIDPKSGAWHWSVDEYGKPNLEEDKAGLWIAPYHNSRMCMEMIHRLSN